MGKFDKFKKILDVSSVIAKPFLPGVAGSMLDQVNNVVNNPHQTSDDAVKTLAKEVDEYNHEQDLAILALHERLKKAGF